MRNGTLRFKKVFDATPPTMKVCGSCQRILVKQDGRDTVALSKKSLQTRIFCGVVKLLAPMCSLMIGSGPQRERPIFPKNIEDVARSPRPRGIIAGETFLSVVARSEDVDILILLSLWVID